MISSIEAAIQDLKMICHNLPLYIPEISEYRHISHIASGISMGGHTVKRAVVRYPGVFDVAAPINDCFDLTILLLNKLGEFDSTELHKGSYDDLCSSFDQSKYPRALFDLVSKEDEIVANEYDFIGLNTIAIFGELDPLVPLKILTSILGK